MFSFSKYVSISILYPVIYNFQLPSLELNVQLPKFRNFEYKYF